MTLKPWRVTVPAVQEISGLLVLLHQGALYMPSPSGKTSRARTPDITVMVDGLGVKKQVPSGTVKDGTS